ncbi:MAG: hypothetical protein AB7H71_01330 [Alphaproteobacteria bacterium]
MLVYQGDYGSLGNLASVARGMARFDIIVLSHASDRGPTRKNTGNCVDTRFEPLSDLIRLVRRFNPEVQVFGYISATADAPIGSGCGLVPGTRYSERPWECPQDVCRNSMSWVDDWLDLDEEVDGIFVDLAAPTFISAGTRDNIFSYIRSQGLRIMANTTTPSAANVAFAGSSRYIGEGDFLMIEGFFFTGGNANLAQTLEAASRLRPLRGKGVLLAALATEAWATEPGPGLSCRLARAQEAADFFADLYEPGDVFEYTSADLGVSSRALPRPCF